MIKVPLATRVAGLEKLTKVVEKTAENLKAEYDDAVRLKDEGLSAETARALRDKLLQNTDSEMLIDRAKIDFTSIATFFESMQSLFAESNMTRYRRHLRDIPEQPGFPFEIDWGQNIIAGDETE